MSSCPAIVFPCFIVSTWVSPNENMSSQMDVNCFQAEIICLLYYLMVIFSSLFFSAFNNSGSNSIELKKAFKAASYNLSCCERNGTFNIFWYLQKSKKPCQRWNWSRKSLPKKGENPPLEKIAFPPTCTRLEVWQCEKTIWQAISVCGVITWQSIFFCESNHGKKDF